MWYESTDFWIGIGITAIVIALSYVVRIYITKFLFWYQYWSVDFNKKSYDLGKKLRKKYDGKFGNGNVAIKGTQMYSLRK